MYLKKLKANKSTFHTIEFRPNNLNIILGSRSKSDDKNNTVNGVGKTLSIKLIDFCLGCRQDAHKEINKLTGWEFQLQFESNNSLNQIIRDVDNDKISLNSKELKLNQFKEYMQAEFYKNVEDYKFLSFRSLICRNLRIPKAAYVSWDKYKASEEAHISLLNNAFLLGLSVGLIINKIDLKDEINKIDKSSSYIRSDETIKSAIIGTDVRISISNVEKEVINLENKLKQFKISEGYNEVKASIEETKIKKNDLINQIVKCENIIDSINGNLDLKVDVTSRRVEELYAEAKIVFPEDMLKKMEDISKFHEKLLEGRKARLVKDKDSYKSEIKKLKKQLKELDSLINQNMDFIKDKVSTTEYESIQDRLTEYKIQLDKLNQYDNVMKGFEHSKAEIKAKLATDNVNALAYIDSIIAYKKELSEQFQKYVDYIYGENKYSGIDIVNNDGENKNRFDINVEIQDEDSGGVGNVKIFCMDLLIWERQINNNIDFIYHDGSLFSETDPRQCYKMLKLAYQVCEKRKRQYIVNMNYDMFDNIIKAATENDDKIFAKYLEESIRLRLYDDSPNSKLLGIQMK